MKKFKVQADRILLRTLTIEDSESLYHYRNIPEVSVFQGWTPISPKEVSDYAIAMANRETFNYGDWYQIVIQDKKRQVLGDLGVCIDTETNQQAELGVALDPRFQKQGFATDAVKLICKFLFTEKNIRRIHVSIDPRNTASLNLFARTGFRQEAHHIESVFFKGEWCDDIVMALLKSEWRK